MDECPNRTPFCISPQEESPKASARARQASEVPGARQRPLQVRAAWLAQERRVLPVARPEQQPLVES